MDEVDRVDRKFFSHRGRRSERSRAGITENYHTRPLLFERDLFRLESTTR